MKKITILGGAGFIGHNLVISLKKLGYKCQILDSLEVNNLRAKNILISEIKIIQKGIK